MSSRLIKLSTPLLVFGVTLSACSVTAAVEGNATMVDSNVTAADPCVADFTDEYNTPLHIAAIFIIMFFSSAGTMAPIMARKIKSLGGVTAMPFQCAKLFGAGVIIATAWVHMFSPADQTLTNPCLPELFTNTYTSWAGAIALLGALSTHLIQFLASRAIRRELGDNHTAIPGTASAEPDPNAMESANTSKSNVTSLTPNSIDHFTADEHGHHLVLIKEKHITTYLLELGVAIHSVIIGLTLGVSRGGEFASLVVALTFHQFFEGLALSTVVLESKFEKNIITYGMIVFYTLTTPIGIAIGVAVASSYNGNGRKALITQGVLDSLSAGILTYDALVNIIFMHFSAPALHKLPEWTHVVQLFFLWLGAGVMALIGRWA